MSDGPLPSPSRTASQKVTAEVRESGAVALRVRGVFRRYGFHWALRGVDLTVARGSVLALIGPNGSGKTTLLKVIATGLRPTRGTVEVLGLDVARSPDEVRRRVGLLSHHTYLYEELTALENLRFAAAMYGVPNELGVLEAALRSVGLGRVGRAQVRTFSSGMKKRLALARAQLHGPDLVLLDEPYGALDTEGLAWVDRSLLSARGHGRTVIVATHHVERVLPLSQQVVWLAEGRVVYDGPPDGLPPHAGGPVESGPEG